MSSAEESSEPRESEAAQALSELQTQQQRGETGENVFVPPPPAVSSAEETPLSSVPPSPQVSLAYGSPHPPGSFHASLPSADSSLFSPAPPAPGDEASRWFNPSTIRPQSAKLPSRSVKRIASPIELRSPKSRRDSHGSQEPLDMPTSSTGAQLSPAPHQHDPNRASGRARAPASIGSRAPTNTREPQAGGRLARRPRKNPPQPADPGRFVGAPIYYGPGVGMIAPYAFLNSFKTSTPRELGSAGPPSSLGYREPVGSSFHNDPSLAAQGPPLSQPQGFTFPRHRSGHPSPPPGSSAPREVPAHLSPSTSYPVYPPWSLAKPSSSPGSFSLPYGSPGVAIPPTPYQMLPAPKSSGSQAPVQRSSSFQAPAQSSSVEADGYMMIRNAISIDLVREVVAVVERGLPVSKRSETASTYMTPVQAYRVRDDFVKVC